LVASSGDAWVDQMVASKAVKLVHPAAFDWAESMVAWKDASEAVSSGAGKVDLLV